MDGIFLIMQMRQPLHGCLQFVQRLAFLKRPLFMTNLLLACFRTALEAGKMQ